MCEHEDFKASVAVGRLTGGATMKYTAEVKISCAQCGRQFQFLGLEPGVDQGGARVSIDGMEARLAICPQGEVPSTLDNIAVNFRPAQTN